MNKHLNERDVRLSHAGSMGRRAHCTLVPRDQSPLF